MCWGGGDVWVEQGHLVQYFGFSRIRSIMSSMALHNLKVPLASETSPHLCQADLILSAVFAYCLTFMAPGEMRVCWQEILDSAGKLCVLPRLWRMAFCLYHSHSLIPQSHRSRTGFSAKSLFPCVKVQKALHVRQSLFSVVYSFPELVPLYFHT